MAIYRVVFAEDGDKPREELVVDALKIEVAPDAIKFVRTENPGKVYAAVIPSCRILYIEATDM